MEAPARIGLLITCLLAVCVGGRTLFIWRRTRMLPELCIGTNVLAIAVGGVMLTLLGGLGGRAVASDRIVPYAFGLLALVVHVAALYVGTWKIFRPADRWAPAVVAVGSGLACTWMIATLWADSGVSALQRMLLFQSARGAGMGWAAFECFHYSAMLRRRVVLGLAEPMVAHRIWLWGAGATASLIAIGLEIGSWLIAGAALASTPPGLHAMSLLGLIGTTMVALAFFPPAAYTRLIDARRVATSAVVTKEIRVVE